MGPIHKEQTKFENDDHSRYAGPEYLDRISLSSAYGHRNFSAEGKGPKGYQRPDARIYEDVCEALLNDPQVDASDIEIEVHSGIVTLRGSVESRRMKREVEICIEHVAGLRDIFNLLNLYQFTEAGGQGLVKSQARLEP